jgi:hypothetical protein
VLPIFRQSRPESGIELRTSILNQIPAFLLERGIAARRGLRDLPVNPVLVNEGVTPVTGLHNLVDVQKGLKVGLNVLRVGCEASSLRVAASELAIPR